MRPVPQTPSPFSTPRAWASLSRTMDLAEESGILTPEVVRALAFGRISAEDAAVFCIYVENNIQGLLACDEYIKYPEKLPSTPTERWFVLHNIDNSSNAQRYCGVGRKSEKNDALLRKVKTALNLARIKLPYLSGFFAIMKVQIDERCPTACVFASGRTLIHPQFADSLTSNELFFILAHEALHLLLRTHERRRAGDKSGYLENIAHDFIINDRLVRELHPAISDSEDISEKGLPPSGGLWWPNYREDFENHCKGRTWKTASEYSLEELVACLKCIQRDFRAWSVPPSKKKQGMSVDSENINRGGLGNTSGGFGDQIAALLNLKESSETNEENQKQLELPSFPDNQDVLSGELEEQLFPGDPTNGPLQEKVFLELAKRATAEKNVLDQIALIQSLQWGNGGYSGQYDALRGLYRPPWEAALQRWFDTQNLGIGAGRVPHVVVHSELMSFFLAVNGNPGL